MSHNTSLLQSVFKNTERIVQLLGIDSFSEDDQLKIVKRFGDILLKRILLRIPEDKTEEIQSSLNQDFGIFLETLDRVLPNAPEIIEEEFQKTVADFHSKKQ